MARGRDEESKPSKGRAFPFPLAEVLRLVSTAAIKNAEGRRPRVVLRNPTVSEGRNQLIAEFDRGSVLHLLSVPAESMEEARQAWPVVIAYCGWLARRDVPSRSGLGPVYAFEKGRSVQCATVVERWYHYQTLKYRGTDKFTGGLNRKLLKIDEYAVHLPDPSELPRGV